MRKLTSVLLVDDDSTTNFLNKLLFSRLGITEKLIVTENGEEALTALEGLCSAATPDCPNLILLDVNMPVMNGFEFLEAYQQLSPAQRQSTVVMLLTTSVHQRDLARVHQLPIAGTITKPLTQEKLRLLWQQHFPE